LLRALTAAGIAVFFKKRTVLHREHLRFDGPAIVISNHPSTLMDVLNIGVSIRQEMFYLANYSLFKHPVANWLLSRLYCIPIKRKEDVPEGEERNNEMAFEQSYRHLEQNGILFIAPEGVSWMNRWVRPFKTGTARISLGMAARNDWQTDLKIIPVGLSYSAPNLFRSNIVVQVQAPVYLRDWQEKYEKDPENTILELTQYLENCVRSATIDTGDEAGEKCLTRLEYFLEQAEPLNQVDAFKRSQELALMGLTDPTLEQATNDYFDGLEQAGLTDQGLNSLKHPKQALGNGLRLTLGWPLAIMGYAFWFLPCFIPAQLNKKMQLYIGYSSTVKILSGLLIFPVFIGVYHWLATLVWPNGYLAWGFVAYIALLGPFTERYLQSIEILHAYQKAKRLFNTSPTIIHELQEKRERLHQVYFSVWQNRSKT
jgi:glycerol-3-phosphate O-acyltransferase/dihydroxyacetone phosphate acyltransferase